MGKTIVLKKPSVLPWYLAGIVGLLCSFVLPVDRLWGLIVMLVISAVAFAVGKRVFPAVEYQAEVPFDTGDATADEILKELQNAGRQLHQLDLRIEDEPLSAAIRRMERALHAMGIEVEKNLTQARVVRRFCQRYLGDTIHLLEQYADLERLEIQGQNVDAIRRQVEENAQVIAGVFENQLNELLGQQVMENEVNLQVLKNLLQQGKLLQNSPDTQDR